MSDSTLRAQIEAARAYDGLFVPALFGQWAARVADAAALCAGESALDVACGTGALTREMSGRLGAGAKASGLDANPGMIAVAREHVPGADWRIGVAEELPYADNAFDAVLCQFGLMFFDDRMRAVREMMRVLMPGGRLVVAVWDDIGRNSAFAAEADLLGREAGADAADAVRAPFSIGGKERVPALLTEAGAQEVAAERIDGTARFADVRTMVEAEVRGWLPLAGVVLDEPTIGRVLEAAPQALAPWVTDDGRVEAPLSVVLVRARKPSLNAEFTTQPRQPESRRSGPGRG